MADDGHNLVPSTIVIFRAERDFEERARSLFLEIRTLIRDGKGEFHLMVPVLSDRPLVANILCDEFVSILTYHDPLDCEINSFAIAYGNHGSEEPIRKRITAGQAVQVLSTILQELRREVSAILLEYSDPNEWRDEPTLPAGAH